MGGVGVYFMCVGCVKRGGRGLLLGPSEVKVGGALVERWGLWCAEGRKVGG